MNSVKDLILKLSHYHSDVYLDELDLPLLASRYIPRAHTCQNKKSLFLTTT
jgi:hypothetical protein